MPIDGAVSLLMKPQLEVARQYCKVILHRLGWLQTLAYFT